MKGTRKHFGVWVLVFAAGLFWMAPVSLAESPKYPTKAIDLIVGFSPGGGADVAARLMAAFASKKWDHPVKVINMAGGSGAIATQKVLTSEPDGYTLLTDCHATASMMAAVLTKLPFDWEKRTWVCRMTLDPLFYMVKADSKWKTLQDVLSAIKQDPKSFKWGSGGASAISTFAMAQLFTEAGINIKETNMVAFKGGAPNLVALAGGHVDFAAQQLSEIKPLVSAGKIRPLAVVAPERIPGFPDVPTNSDAGFPNLNVIGWQGISGPPGLPQNVVDAWIEVMKQASKDPDFLDKADKVGKVISFLATGDFKAAVMKEYAAYSSLASRIGLGK